METITILGATGSIGQSTIDVVVLHPDRFKVRALSGHTRMAVLAQAAKKTMAECVVVPDSDAARVFRLAWGSGGQLPEIRVGSQALEETAAEAGTDIVMAAIVGIAGLPSVLSAARAGKKVLLANKESLVAAGSLLMAAVENHGATLLPIDSEHNAIFQCMPNRPGNLHASGKDGVRKLILTASGGPFRRIALSQLKAVTPDQACAHPNWDMGRKNFGRFSHDAQQRARGHRGALAVLNATRPNRSFDTPPKYRPFHGSVCRWLRVGSAWQSRHENAHRPRACPS